MLRWGRFARPPAARVAIKGAINRAEPSRVESGAEREPHWPRWFDPDDGAPPWAQPAGLPAAPDERDGLAQNGLLEPRTRRSRAPPLQFAPTIGLEAASRARNSSRDEP